MTIKYQSLLPFIITLIFIGAVSAGSKYDDIHYWFYNVGSAAWFGWITAKAYPLVNNPT